MPVVVPERNTLLKVAVNFASRSRTRNRIGTVQAVNMLMRLRACWVTHSPVGCEGGSTVRIRFSRRATALVASMVFTRRSDYLP